MLRAHGAEVGGTITVTMDRLLTELKVHKKTVQDIVTYEDKDTPVGNQAWASDVVVMGAAFALRQKTLKLADTGMSKKLTLMRDPLAVRAACDIGSGDLSFHIRLSPPDHMHTAMLYVSAL